MSIEIIRTNSEHPDFIDLVKLLDAYLAEIDGDEHAFYAPHNTITQLKYTVIAYSDGIAVGCGAIKLYQSGTMEVKRMFVQPAYRGKGIAGQMLATLEQMAKELAMEKCILETGKRQEDAVQLYIKNGYQLMPNYAPYEQVENSICFEKQLS